MVMKMLYEYASVKLTLSLINFFAYFGLGESNQYIGYQRPREL